MGIPADVRIVRSDSPTIGADIKDAVGQGFGVYFVDNMRLATKTVLRYPSARVILDIGDDASSLAQTVGASRPTVIALRILQTVLEHRSDGIIVRGLGHAAALAARGHASRTCVIPDAVVLDDRFTPKPRPRAGLCIGFVGHTKVSSGALPAGWEIPEVLAQLPADFSALMIIAGTGVAWLRRRLLELGVSDRCTIIDGCPPDKLALASEPADVFVSTQTPNLAGHVRTTGKLVEYLGLGRPTVASRVGTAAAVLPPSLTVATEEVFSTQYVSAVAQRIVNLRNSSDDQFEALQRYCRSLAERLFDSRELGQLWLETMRQWNHLP